MKYGSHKFCALCSRILPIESFQLQRKNDLSKRQYYCRPCNNLKRRQYPKYRVDKQNAYVVE